MRFFWLWGLWCDGLAIAFDVEVWSDNRHIVASNLEIARTGNEGMGFDEVEVVGHFPRERDLHYVERAKRRAYTSANGAEGIEERQAFALVDDATFAQKRQSRGVAVVPRDFNRFGDSPAFLHIAQGLQRVAFGSVYDATDSIIYRHVRFLLFCVGKNTRPDHPGAPILEIVSERNGYLRHILTLCKTF